jgi:membrane associated rhomboid family serine protease
MSYQPAADIPDNSPSSTAVAWLIGVNVALYFLQLTVVSPADVRGALGFEVGNLDRAWWTVGTYMFVHAGFLTLALNVFALWRFGPRIEQQWGSVQFAGYYVLCGLGGWFFHMLFARQGVLIGASAAVLGVMIAYASRWPRDTMVLFGVAPLSIRWFVALYTVAILLAGMSGDAGAGVAYLAHLGGLVTGWAYVRMAGSMNIDSLRQRVAPVADEPDDMPPRAVPPRSMPRPRGERESRDVDEIVQQSQAAIAERATGATHRESSQHTPPGGFSSTELNSLLDKISAQGLDALTLAERTRLEDAARRLKDQ